MFPLERDPALDSFHPRENRVVSFPRPSPDEKKRMERGRSGLDPLKGDRSIIVISSVDNNGHWPLGGAALLPLLPPSPIHLPLILERIDRASRILGFQGWFTGPLSLPTLRIVDFVPVESGIAYLLELSILDSSKFDSVLSNCNGRSFEIELRSNKIRVLFCFLVQPGEFFVVQIPRDSRDFQPSSFPPSRLDSWGGKRCRSNEKRKKEKLEKR